MMKIAVLGWGSLIWNPKGLKIIEEWKKDGPMLPIEFARISNNGRLTLVIKTDSKPVQVLWTLMDFNDLKDARINLQEREETPLIDRIGFVDLTENTESSRYHGISGIILEWAKAKKNDAVIWTDLGVKFKDRLKVSFNTKNALSYLSTLPDDKKLLAKEYIINAPSQINTALREEIEDKFGWKK